MHYEICKICRSKIYDQKNTKKIGEQMEVHCFKIFIFYVKYIIF